MTGHPATELPSQVEKYDWICICVQILFFSELLNYTRESEIQTWLTWPELTHILLLTAPLPVGKCRMFMLALPSSFFLTLQFRCEPEGWRDGQWLWAHTALPEDLSSILRCVLEGPWESIRYHFVQTGNQALCPRPHKLYGSRPKGFPHFGTTRP